MSERLFIAYSAYFKERNNTIHSHKNTHILIIENVCIAYKIMCSILRRVRKCKKCPATENIHTTHVLSIHVLSNKCARSTTTRIIIEAIDINRLKTAHDSSFEPPHEIFVVCQYLLSAHRIRVRDADTRL